MQSTPPACAAKVGRYNARMSDVQFDSDNQNEFGAPPVSSGGDFTGALIRWGLVSSRQAAEYVLVGVAVVAIVAAVIAYWYL